jgi:hypothetical protein
MPDPIAPTQNITGTTAQKMLVNADEFESKVNAATASYPKPEAAPHAAPPKPVTATASPPRRCVITEGPQYSPSGDVPVQRMGREKYAFFAMSARFDNNKATGHDPSCCEVRQYIKWDDAYHTSNGGRPHGGFNEKAGPNLYHEDVEEKGVCHYGHRDENCNGSNNNQYYTAGKEDPAHGDIYNGWDRPRVDKRHQGAFEFELRIIDRCNQNAVRGVSPHVRVQW